MIVHSAKLMEFYWNMLDEMRGRRTALFDNEVKPVKQMKQIWQEITDVINITLEPSS